ncbi:MAG TPA: DUF222 domain-containing protein [Jatrophihabitans sp.]|nr:DUF222 domain-containing protein [Jatrophihabitans sp.]
MIDSVALSPVSGPGLDVPELAALRDRLGELDQDVEDAVRIDRIRVLEELKSAVAAAQARETAAFAAGQRAAQAAAGVPADRASRGIAAQVGLARRISPWAAQRYTGWAVILTRELPATYAALAAGRVSEWRPMLVARETGWLSRQQRAVVDADLAPHLAGWGDRRVEAEARRAGYRLDPTGYLARVRGAEKDRRVTVRLAPDVMARVSALLPAAQGVACYAALRQAADTLRAAGDRRGHGQVMADVFVERLTGQSTASDLPVEINVIMTDRTLLHPETCGAETEMETETETGTCRGQEPAVLLGYGPIPAAAARGLISRPGVDTPVWIRRLYTHPHTGQLAAMDSHRRSFTANQHRFLTVRDQTCATLWCDAPIRHTDHLIPAEAAGPTSVANGRGTCATCNYAKQAPGWSTVPTSDVAGEIVLTTPTGHTYRSRPPDPPGSRPADPTRSARPPTPKRPAA